MHYLSIDCKIVQFREHDHRSKLPVLWNLRWQSYTWSIDTIDTSLCFRKVRKGMPQHNSSLRLFATAAKMSRCNSCIHCTASRTWKATLYTQCRVAAVPVYFIHCPFWKMKESWWQAGALTHTWPSDIWHRMFLHNYALNLLVSYSVALATVQSIQLLVNQSGQLRHYHYITYLSCWSGQAGCRYWCSYFRTFYQRNTVAAEL